MRNYSLAAVIVGMAVLLGTTTANAEFNPGVQTQYDASGKPIAGIGSIQHE